MYASSSLTVSPSDQDFFTLGEKEVHYDSNIHLYWEEFKLISNRFNFKNKTIANMLREEDYKAMS
jgi:hypothetical protein